MAHPARRPLNQSPRYRSFILDRDRALEKLHLKCQMRITDELGGALQRVLEILSYWYGQSHGSVYALGHLEHQLETPFKDALPRMVKAIQDMRRRTYTLSHAGEVEAIARAIGKPQSVNLHVSRIVGKASEESPAGGELNHRVALYLDRIRHKIVDAVKVSAINNESLSDLLDKVWRVLPKVRYYKRPPRVLKPIREADINLTKGQILSVGFIDDNEWQDMVDDYTSDYIFTNRGPDGVLAEPEQGPQYEWELEKDVTQDFVQQVRDGQVDAAKDNGITDFVWIAIVDDRTDDCCLWRNGLTSQEILDALKNEHADDECDAETPPAHFNCRCSLAPMTDDMPEVPPPNMGDFEDWLNQTTS